MVACLDALENLKRVERKEITWDAAVDSLEDAIEALDAADHHLLRGTSAPSLSHLQVVRTYAHSVQPIQGVWPSPVPIA